MKPRVLTLTAGYGEGHNAAARAREAAFAGCERVVPVGGDGTMKEVAQALLYTPAALALVPCCSGAASRCISDCRLRCPRRSHWSPAAAAWRHSTPDG